jgi:hypothetical protein
MVQKGDLYYNCNPFTVRKTIFKNTFNTIDFVFINRTLNILLILRVDNVFCKRGSRRLYSFYF